MYSESSLRNSSNSLTHVKDDQTNMHLMSLSVMEKHHQEEKYLIRLNSNIISHVKLSIFLEYL